MTINQLLAVVGLLLGIAGFIAAFIAVTWAVPLVAAGVISLGLAILV